MPYNNKNSFKKISGILSLTLLVIPVYTDTTWCTQAPLDNKQNEEQLLQPDEIEDIYKQYKENLEKDYLVENNIDIKEYQSDTFIDQIVNYENYARRQQIANNNKSIIPGLPPTITIDQFSFDIATRETVYKGILLGTDIALNHYIYNNTIERFSNTILSLCKEKKIELKTLFQTKSSQQKEDQDIATLPIHEEIRDILLTPSEQSFFKRLAYPLFGIYITGCLGTHSTEALRSYLYLRNMSLIEAICLLMFQNIANQNYNHNRLHYTQQSQSAIQNDTKPPILDDIKIPILDIFFDYQENKAGRLYPYGKSITNMLKPSFITSGWFLLARRIAFTFLFFHKSISSFFSPLVSNWLESNNDLIKNYLESPMQKTDDEIILKSCNNFFSKNFDLWQSQKTKSFSLWASKLNLILIATKMIPLGWKNYQAYKNTKNENKPIK